MPTYQKLLEIFRKFCDSPLFVFDLQEYTHLCVDATPKFQESSVPSDSAQPVASCHVHSVKSSFALGELSVRGHPCCSVGLARAILLIARTLPSQHQTQRCDAATRQRLHDTAAIPTRTFDLQSVHLHSPPSRLCGVSSRS